MRSYLDRERNKVAKRKITMKANPDKRNVQRHYNTLAAGYSDLTNKYCQERYKKLINHYAKHTGSILDIGCGDGQILKAIWGEVKVGTDISKEICRSAKICDFLLTLADSEHLPIKNNYFDMVTCINVVEHVSNVDSLIKEAKRVLKKRGLLIIITPNGDIEFLLDIADSLKLKVPEGPHKFLKTKELVEMIMSNDLKILSKDKMITIPRGPYYLIRLGELLEKKFKGICFFEFVVAEKV